MTRPVNDIERAAAAAGVSLADLQGDPEIRRIVGELRDRVNALRPVPKPPIVRTPPRIKRKSQTKPKPPADRVKERICLKCGDGFTSSGPGHRICDRCKAGVNDTAPYLEGVSW